MSVLIIFLLICLTILLIGARCLYSYKAKLDKYLKTYVKQGWFSGSVLIAKNGKILLCKGYGMANYEHDITNKPQTIFRLGSISKQFTSMLVMQLQEKGLLHVNDSLSKYIPDYPSGDKITIHHLLTHTAGIPNYVSFSLPEYKNEKIKPHTIEQIIEIFKNKPLEFKAGEKHSYSNSGYTLLSYIIEKASGKKYEIILKENIFDPLNMKHSGYDNYSRIIKNRASGYDIVDDDLANASYIDMSFPTGAGGLYSTVEDLYIWDQALYTEKLVSRKTLNEIFTPFINEYGYGWRIKSLFNHTQITHSGLIDGFATDIHRYPDDNICIIVLSNFQRSPLANVITPGLAAIVFGEKYELPKKQVVTKIDPMVYDQYVGKYKLRENFIITVTKEDNKLITQATGQHKFQIYPESETEFFLKAFYAQGTFVKDEKGKVTKLILHQDGKDLVAEKVD